MNKLKDLSEAKGKTSMAPFKIFRDDMRILFSDWKKTVIIIVLALIPLLYSFLYLDAFWDPYSKLDQMPVAVVNMDKGSEKDNKPVHYGQDLVNELKDNKKVKWEFVNRDEAEKGLEGKKFYSMVVIPENFSQKITDATIGKTDKASLLYIANEKKNYLAAQVSSRIMLELKDQVAQSITEEGSKTVIDNLFEIKDKIKDASDGSGELSKGLKDLNAGLITFDKESKDGKMQLLDGSSKLASGVAQLHNGLRDMHVQASEGEKGLKSGAFQLHKGLKDLDKQASEAEKRLKSGSSQLYSGLKDMNTQASEGEKKLKTGVSQLYGGLKEMDQQASEGEKKLGSGVDQLNTGLKDMETQASEGERKLITGASQLNNGLKDMDTQALEGEKKLVMGGSQLYNGIKDLDMRASDGEKKLSDNSQNLASGIGNINQGLKQLYSGFASNNPGELDTLVGGSSSISSGISTAADAVKSADLALQSVTDAINASNLSVQDKAKIAQVCGILAQLDSAGNLPALKTGAAHVATGIQQVKSTLATQSSTAVQALQSLSSGADLASQGANALHQGIEDYTAQVSKARIQLVSGSNQLNLGLGDYLSKVTSGRFQLIGGSNQLNLGLEDYVSKVTSGRSQLINGAGQLSSGLNDYVSKVTSGRSQLIDGADQVNSGLQDYVFKVSLGRSQLLGGSGQLNSGIEEYISKVMTGRSQLLSGSSQLNSGIDEYVSKVATGRSRLLSGADELNLGVSQLYNGMKEFDNKTAEGVKQILNGETKAYDGSNKLYGGLKDGYREINDKLTFTSEDMSKFLAHPVNLDEKPVHHVSDYGSGFTPYFVPLSLWVGALLMFIVMPQEFNKRFKNKPRSIIFGKFLVLMIVGVLQAVISSIAILAVLKLDVESVPLFIGFNILLSVSFIAIIQALINILGNDVGRFVSLVLLMLQLTSCGGTFPMELVPKFFQYINPWLPMSYATSALREIISGIDYSVLYHDVFVLSLFLIGSMALAMVFKARAPKIKQKIVMLRNTGEGVA